MLENKTLIREYFRALSGGSKAPSIVARYVADPKLAEHIAASESAFPGYELTADEIIAEGDLVVVRGQMKGVHRGTFAGIDATGKPVSAGIIIIYRVKGDKIVEHWMQFDMFSLLQQLQSVEVANA